LVLGPELAGLRGSADWDAEEGVCLFGECLFNGWNYSLIEILRDAGSSIDIVTHHNYTDDAASWWSELMEGESAWTVQLADAVRDVTDAYAPGKPVWMTEYGWMSQPFGSMTDIEAAAELEETMLTHAAVVAGTAPEFPGQSWPELETIFWYDLHDDDAAQWSFGLVNSSGGPKAPYATAVSTLASLGGCPDPPKEEKPPEPADDDDSESDDDDSDDDRKEDPTTDDDDDDEPLDDGDEVSDDDSETGNGDEDDGDPELSGEPDLDFEPSPPGGCSCFDQSIEEQWLFALLLVPALGRRRRPRRGRRGGPGGWGGR
jgi:hypothetical protein